jgi:hypothetical protein
VTNDMLARAVRDGIARTIAVAGTLIRASDARAWAAAALLLGALIGYTFTRTVDLPQAMGDIGNWTEPLGLASLFVEGSLVALACTMLAGLRGATPGRLALAEAVRA